MLSSQSAYESSRVIPTNAGPILNTYTPSRTLNINTVRSFTYASILIADLSSFIAAGIISMLARYEIGGHFRPTSYINCNPSLFIIVFLMFAISGLYPGIAINPIEEFRRVIRSASLGFLFLIGVTIFLRQEVLVSGICLVLNWTLTMLLVPICRNIVRKWCSGKEWWGIPTVIIGERAAADMTLGKLQRDPALGLKPVAVLYDECEKSLAEKSDRNKSEQVFLGNLSHSGILARDYRSCYAILAMPLSGSDRLARMLTDHVHQYSRVLVIPDFFGVTSLSVNAKDICGILVLEVTQQLTRCIPRKLKRCLDVLLCTAIGVFLLPVIFCLYLAIRFTSKGPCFYGQRRIGRGGKEFVVWKFRSMVTDADKILARHLEQNPELRLEWETDHKLRRDPRVTPMGRMLRKTSLDELPQLWNVLCGEMSLVGPRPIVQSEVQKYGKSFRQYCQVTPGITGLWQISGRNNTTYELRTQIDEYYVCNWSAYLDLYILAKTLKTVLRGEGAY